jgi:hypothetical protein
MRLGEWMGLSDAEVLDIVGARDWVSAVGLSDDEVLHAAEA